MTLRPRARTTNSPSLCAGLLSALACAALLAPEAAARQDATLTILMELNRNGKWDEAARGA